MSDCPNLKDYGENGGGKNNYSKKESFSRHETKFRPKAEKHLQKMVAAIASGLQSAVDLSDIDFDQSDEDDEDRIDHIERPYFFLFSDLIRSFHSVSPPYQRLVSATFLETVFAITSRMILMILLNSPIADE